MHNYWWCAFLFRVFLPCVVASASFIRPTVTSYIYMTLGCYIPFFAVPTKASMKGATGTLIKLLMVVCILICSMIASFYFVLLVYSSAGWEFHLDPCSTLEKLLRTIGIVDYTNLPMNDAIYWCIPEPLMLGTVIILHYCFKKMTEYSSDMFDENIEIDGRSFENIKEINRKKLINLLMHFGKYWVCFILCLTATLKPTALGAFYYVIFLAVLTYWGCNQKLGKVFARILICLLPIVFLHITIIFVYQFQYLQDSTTFETNSLWGRLFNLVDLKTYKDCIDPRRFLFHKHTKATYAVPFCLFVLYHSSILVARQVLNAEDGLISLIAAFFHRENERDTSARWRRTLKKLQQKIEDEKAMAQGPNVQADKIKIISEQIFQFLFSIAYLMANFVMMFWAVAFVNWESFILLIWANVIWLFPFRKKLMLILSPILVVYIIVLLCVTYLYSLNLTSDELPSKIGFLKITTDVFYNWVELFTKSMLGVIIFITMRQFWQERAIKRQEEEIDRAMGEGLATQGYATSFITRFQKKFVNFFALWWIWLVIIVMIWMDFWSTSNLFRIVFVGLAMLFLLTFQLCSFRYWKKFLRVYWWSVIIYAMGNLMVLYMYQLPETRRIFYKYVTEGQFRRVGFLLWTDAKQRFVALLHPLFFQIAVVIQQNYFQKEFDRLTSPLTPTELAEEEENTSQNVSKISAAISNFTHIVCSILEVHLLSIILLLSWYLFLFDLCAIYAPFVLLFTLACLAGKKFAKFVIYLVSFVVQILIVARLVYMNQYTEHKKWNFIGHYKRNEKSYNVTLNFADWLGFHESTLGKDYADFKQLVWCFAFVFAVTLDRIVGIRMKNYRTSRNLPKTDLKVIFPEVTFENCHESVANVLKFIANYGLYKFGCEITFIFATILVAIRMDSTAILVATLLLCSFSLNRVWLKRIWLPVLMFLAFSIPWQYVTTLGWWPSYFQESQTIFWNSTDLLLRIQQFFYLMNMVYPPDERKITCDFVMLLIMSRQWVVFSIESKMKDRYNPAGSNDNVSKFIDDPNVDNPVPDFMTYFPTYLDNYKRIVIGYWLYVALLVTLLAGAMRATVYSIGYILGSFLFLWEGNDLFLRPPKSILRRWNLLIAYNLLVILAKAVSQIFGCILKYESTQLVNCYIYRLLAIGCVDKFGMTKNVQNIHTKSSCDIDPDALGLFWDSLCFFCLICQQRLFKSFHFFHIVNDVKAHCTLADRGAELIEEQRFRKRAAIDKERRAIENNIKKKMERINANKDKIEDIRAGIYYNLDEVEKDLDIPLLPPPEDEDDSDYESYDPMPLTEYFGLFYTTDVETVLDITAMRRKRKEALSRRAAGKKIDTKTNKNAKRVPKSKILKVVLFIVGIFESVIVSITGVINRKTKDFRAILKKIDTEKRILKEKTNYKEGVRLGANKIWHPTEFYRDIILAEQDDSKDSSVIQYSIYWKLPMAICYLIMNYSEWLCYLVLILNQALKGNFMSLPLMMMVFCWGSLTVPKPTKTFWIINIACLLIMAFIKIMMNIDVTPWNEKTQSDNLFFPPKFLGYSGTRIWLTFFLLAAFFYHRMVLHNLGLWKPFRYRNVALMQDGSYGFKNGQFKYQPKDTKDGGPLFDVKTIKVSMGDYFPTSIVHGLRKYAEGFRMYCQQLINPSSTQIPVDVYTYMFFCDFFNMFLLIFFYGSFQNDASASGLIGFITDNRVPPTFIVIFLGYLFLMMIDRGLYLRRNRFGKLVYHFLQVAGYHILFFILYPFLTNKPIIKLPVVQTFYIFKCFYFLFSAYQIRNGYPTLISYHCLWHGHTLLHKFFYNLYRIVPYFLEIRCLLDWICSDSCLGIPPWFKMEDITYCLFSQKCEQEFENKWVMPSGQKKNRAAKYLLGGLLYCLLVLTVIFPFLLFSLSSTMGVTTRPNKLKLDLYMGSAEPIFESYASDKDVSTISPKDYESLTGTFNNIKTSDNVFDSFTAEDVLVAKWSISSLSTWQISPGSKQELIKALQTSQYFMLRLVIRYLHTGGHGGAKSEKSFGQSVNIPPIPDPRRQNLLDMLKSNTDTGIEVSIPLLFPKFLMIEKESTPRVLSIMEEPGEQVKAQQEMFAHEEDDDVDLPPDPRRLRNMLIRLYPGKNPWWQLKEDCNVTDDNYLYYLKDLVHNSCDEITLYIFNEKVFSNTMQYITKSGILGLYLLYFMMAIEVIRSCRVEATEIWFKNLPNSNKIYRRCMELYVARDMKNYELEREIFDDLICVMRSRDLLIKLTRFEDNNYDPTYIIPGTPKK